MAAMALSWAHPVCERSGERSETARAPGARRRGNCSAVNPGIQSPRHSWQLCGVVLGMAGQRSRRRAASGSGSRLCPAKRRCFQGFWEGFGVLPSWEDRVLDAAERPGAGSGWLARREVRAGDLLMSISRDAATEVVMDEMEGWEAELAVALLRRLDYLGPAADPRLRQSDELQDLWKDYSRLFPEPVGAAWLGVQPG
eukprot:s1995_g4.t3